MPAAVSKVANLVQRLATLAILEADAELLARFVKSRDEAAFAPKVAFGTPRNRSDISTDGNWHEPRAHRADRHSASTEVDARVGRRRSGQFVYASGREIA